MRRTLALSGIGGTVVIRQSACSFVSDFVADFLTEGDFTVPFSYAALEVVVQHCAEASANQVSSAPSLPVSAERAAQFMCTTPSSREEPPPARRTMAIHELILSPGLRSALRPSASTCSSRCCERRITLSARGC